MNLDTINKVHAVEIMIDSLFDEIYSADDELLTSIERLTNKVGILRACAAQEWVDSGVWAQDPGLISPANALARHINIPRTHAHGLIRAAETLNEFPGIKQLGIDGAISPEHVRSVSASNEPELNDLLHDNEKFMCDILPSVDVHQFARVMRRWKDHARAATNSEPTPDLYRGRRSFHLSTLLDGMYKLDATLEPDVGLMLHQAIEKMSDSIYHAQARAESSSEPDACGDTAGIDYTSPSQLRADAFSVLVRNSITQYNNKRAQPLPLISVDVDYNQLCDRAGYNPLHKKHVDTKSSDLSASILLKLACDAKIIRQITDGKSNILEQGRTTRVVSPALRHFLHRRDQHCTFPGCDRPGNWCDAHHIVHWANGGETNKENLVLLCSTHHTEVHDRDYEIEVTDNGAIFRQRAGP